MLKSFLAINFSMLLLVSWRENWNLPLAKDINYSGKVVQEANTDTMPKIAGCIVIEYV